VPKSRGRSINEKIIKRYIKLKCGGGDLEGEEVSDTFEIRRNNIRGNNIIQRWQLYYNYTLLIIFMIIDNRLRFTMSGFRL